MPKQDILPKEEGQCFLQCDSFKNQAEEEIKKWEQYKKTLESFKKIPQFLEIFSPEEIKEMNIIERTISKTLESFVVLRRLMSPENPDTSEIFKIFEGAVTHRNTLEFFIDTARSKVFDVNITPIQCLLYPYASLRFLILRYLHRTKMKNLYGQ